MFVSYELDLIESVFIKFLTKFNNNLYECDIQNDCHASKRSAGGNFDLCPKWNCFKIDFKFQTNFTLHGEMKLQMFDYGGELSQKNKTKHTVELFARWGSNRQDNSTTSISPKPCNWIHSNVTARIWLLKIEQECLCPCAYFAGKKTCTNNCAKLNETFYLILLDEASNVTMFRISLYLCTLYNNAPKIELVTWKCFVC